MWPACYGFHLRSKELKRIENIISLNVRLDLVSPIKLTIRLVDMSFLTKKSPISEVLRLVFITSYRIDNG